MTPFSNSPHNPDTQSTLYITPAGSADKIAELALTEAGPLKDNPFCCGELEFLSLLEGLELVTVKNALIYKDIMVHTTGHTAALAFNVALSGYYGVQLPGTHSLMQGARTVLCGYHPELNDVFYCPQQDCLQVVALGITSEILLQLAHGQLLPKILYPLLDHPESTVAMMPIVSLNSQLHAIVQQILRCPYQDAIKQFYLQSKVLELFALYLTIFDESKASPRPSRLRLRDLAAVHEAKEHLLATKQHPPSIIELAHAVGINQDKLKRGFQEVFGMTVFEYLRQARLEEAYQLLLNTNLAIKVIAAQVGYTDSKHFAKVFKAKFGKSPEQVR